jgi:hypothetical protein
MELSSRPSVLSQWEPNSQGSRLNDPSALGLKRKNSSRAQGFHSPTAHWCPSPETAIRPPFLDSDLPPRRMTRGQPNMSNPVFYRRIHASCHCGNIRVEFDQPDSGPAIPVRACSCGLCTKHRAAWTSHPDGRFHLRIAEESRVTQYRFGTKTAHFHVYLTRGAIPIVTGMIEEIRYAVFNVNGGATGRQRQSAPRGKTDCATSGLGQKRKSST